MPDEKITITRDELCSPEVDARLKQQEARARAAEHYHLNEDVRDLVALPAKTRRTHFWYNPILYTAFFGLVGGLLAWGLGEVTDRKLLPLKMLNDFREADRFFQANQALRREEDELQRRFRRGELGQLQLRDAEEKLYRAHAKTPVGKVTLEEFELFRRFERGELNQAQLRQARKELMDRFHHAHAKNPVLAIDLNPSLKNEEKDKLIKGLLDKVKPRLVIADLVYYSQMGLFLACFLALADQILGRNWRAAVINGSVGIFLGMLGGILVSLFINQVYWSLGGGRLDRRLAEQMMARAVSWGVLGLFLAIAPGVVLRNGKRLAIGLAGGLVGGVVGGLLFDPLAEAMTSDWPARLLAVAAIGTLTGAGTGLIEQAAKRGWLYVTAGLIAGKQFIVYRNPTVVGSSPRCEIYLFKDPDISPRHAAIHRIHGGFELEDLASATGTRVNGKTVTRVRLRNGDEVQIGSTCLLFRERGQAASDYARPAVSDPAPPPLPTPDEPPARGSDMIWEKKSR